MKSSVKLTLVAAMLAVCAWGCDDDPYLLDNATGTWKVVMQATKTYADGNLVSDITRSDSLPQWELERIGRGIRTHHNAVKDTFTWELHNEEERMILYFKIGPFMNAAILEQDLKSKTLYWENEFADGTVMMKTENTARIEKVQ